MGQTTAVVIIVTSLGDTLQYYMSDVVLKVSPVLIHVILAVTLPMR